LSSERDITFFGVAVYQLIIILIILGICFIAGLLAQTKLARKLIGWMEEMVLDNIPAYRILKNKSQTIIGFEERKSEVVLVKIDDGWQLSFLIEKIGETSCTVFVPDVPDPYSGAVYVVDTKQIIKTAISAKQALMCLRKFGLGAASLLANSKDQLTSPNS
jgi:uncharacterized membrane protein